MKCPKHGVSQACTSQAWHLESLIVWDVSRIRRTATFLIRFATMDMGERLPRFTSPLRSSSGKDGGARPSDDDDSSSGMEFGSPARVDAGGSLARWTRITDGHTGEYVDESVKTAEGGLVELKKKKVDDSRLQIQQKYTNSAGEAVTQFKCSYSQRLGCPYQARMKVGGRADDCIELSERYDHDHGSADKNVRGIAFKLE